MPELRCTVQTCTHNKQFYCALDKIVVEGNTAEKSQDTCCGSFEERKGNSYSNVTGEASASTNIHCEAKERLLRFQALIVKHKSVFTIMIAGVKREKSA